MQTKTLLRYVAIATAVAFLAVALPFFIALRNVPFASNTSTPWAEFGSYFGGVLGPILAGLNLLVVLYIAVRITDIQQNQLETKRLSIDLYNEWHAEAMHQSRIIISDLIDQVRQHGTQLPTLSEFERFDPSRSPHAFRVYHFFEKWAVLHQEGEVDPRIMNAALGGRAAWWNECFFKPIQARENDRYILETLALIDRQVFSLVHASPRR